MPGDDQDIAEAFDEDKLDDDHDEPVDQLDYPPERPLGSTDPTVDDLVTDSVAERDARTEPDPIDTIGRPGAEHPLDRTDQPVGRLVEPGADDDAIFPEDVEADAVADLALGEADVSAEEAAIHVEPE